MRDQYLTALTETDLRWRQALPGAINLFLAVTVLAAFVSVALRYLSPVDTVRNVDYFQFVEMAQGLETGSLSRWVSGMHPIGYPLLIRWGLDVGLDAVRIGHLLSITGGVLLLLSAYLLSFQLTQNRWLALAAEGFMAMTGYFLYFSTWEGNDMLAAGLQGVSLALLIGLSERKRTSGAAGLLAGLAYVVRYTAIVTSALCLLFLAGRALAQRRRSTWAPAGLFLVGFLIGAAVQLIPSTLVTGDPFYSVQGRNVWWHLEGSSDFATEWQQAPENISALRIFLDDPIRFLRHWWRTARSFWLDPGLLLLDTPLRLLTQAALLFTLLAGKEIPVQKRAFLAFYVSGFLGALAVIRYDPRFLIIILPTLVFCAIYFVWAIVPRKLELGRITLPAAALSLTLLLYAAQGVPQHYTRNQAASDLGILTVSRILRASGMRSPGEVLSSAIPFHDVSTPARSRYEQSYWVARDLNSVAELRALASAQGYRFILYDAQTGKTAHPGLEQLLNPNSQPAGLTPLLVPEDRSFVLYRIEPESPQLANPLDVSLDKGIILIGYDLHVAYDGPEMVVPRVGLFLYWQTTESIPDSYKVFVHVMDANHNLMAQSDSVPAAWTMPTQSWQGGQVVVDFHHVPLPAGMAPGTYTLQVGMYHEQTGVRLSVLSPSGAPRDDKITLQQFTVAKGR